MLTYKQFINQPRTVDEGKVIQAIKNAWAARAKDGMVGAHDKELAWPGIFKTRKSGKTDAQRFGQGMMKVGTAVDNAVHSVVGGVGRGALGLVGAALSARVGRSGRGFAYTGPSGSRSSRGSSSSSWSKTPSFTKTKSSKQHFARIPKDPGKARFSSTVRHTGPSGKTTRYNITRIGNPYSPKGGMGTVIRSGPRGRRVSTVTRTVPK
jgi:hypothetical protein